MMKIKSPHILIIGTLITCMVGKCPKSFQSSHLSEKKTHQNLPKISSRTMMKKMK